LRAGLQILFDVVSFRVRRLEMANLAGAVAIMLVLRLEWKDVALRTLFGALLNALVYLNNDYLDVALDLETPDKDARKAGFLREHLRAALGMQWFLVLLLSLLAAWHSPDLLLVLLGGAGICAAYSSVLKHKPLLDVAAMALWGVAMPLCGSPLDRTLGLCLAVQLGLFSAVFQVIQVIRDHDADARLGVRTTAVALGMTRTLWLGRGLMFLCAGYAALVLHPLAGAVALGALMLRMRERRADRYWTAVKVTYGAAWLLACGSILASGHSDGLLLQLDVEATLGLGMR
jgi:4-hydroxybenzoate polyprenyltransferase